MQVQGGGKRGRKSYHPVCVLVCAVAMRGVEGDRWRFPNYWYFTRHVFRNVPRHLSNPFKVNEKLDSVVTLVSGCCYLHLISADVSCISLLPVLHWEKEGGE